MSSRFTCAPEASGQRCQSRVRARTSIPPLPAALAVSPPLALLLLFTAPPPTLNRGVPQGPVPGSESFQLYFNPGFTAASESSRKLWLTQCFLIVGVALALALEANRGGNGWMNKRWRGHL